MNRQPARQVKQRARWRPVPCCSRRRAQFRSYGACCNADGSGNFEYVAGVEVSSFDQLPPELRRMRIPAQHYAVFTHRDHVSAIRGTWYSIWNKWLPESGRETADTPDFERYDAAFDPRARTGKVEICLPLKH